MNVCFPTRCTVTVAFVTRPPASAPVNQELVAGSVIDATRTHTIPAEGVLVSVEEVTSHSSLFEKFLLMHRRVSDVFFSIQEALYVAWIKKTDDDHDSPIKKIIITRALRRLSSEKLPGVSKMYSFTFHLVQNNLQPGVTI